MCEAALPRKECDGAALLRTKRMWLGNIRADYFMNTLRVVPLE